MYWAKIWSKDILLTPFLSRFLIGQYSPITGQSSAAKKKLLVVFWGILDHGELWKGLAFVSSTFYSRRPVFSASATQKCLQLLQASINLLFLEISWHFSQFLGLKCEFKVECLSSVCLTRSKRFRRFLLWFLVFFSFHFCLNWSKKHFERLWKIFWLILSKISSQNAKLLAKVFAKSFTKLSIKPFDRVVDFVALFRF